MSVFSQEAAWLRIRSGCRSQGPKLEEVAVVAVGALPGPQSPRVGLPRSAGVYPLDPELLAHRRGSPSGREPLPFPPSPGTD